MPGPKVHLAWLTAAALAAACSSQEPRSSSAAPQAPVSRQAADVFVVAPDLPPLSAIGVANAPRSPEVVRAVYEFAARRPDVLGYVPCFCGCERAGHRHNEHCFVGSRNAEGKVTSWDTHGVT
jgi:hypothetical protein